MNSKKWVISILHSACPLVPHWIMHNYALLSDVWLRWTIYLEAIPAWIFPKWHIFTNQSVITSKLWINHTLRNLINHNTVYQFTNKDVGLSIPHYESIFLVLILEVISFCDIYVPQKWFSDPNLTKSVTPVFSCFLSNLTVFVRLRRVIFFGITFSSDVMKIKPSFLQATFIPNQNSCPGLILN